MAHALRIGLAMALSAAVLAACGGWPPPSGAPDVLGGGEEEPAPGAADAPRLGELSARELAPGECGLFLWARRDRRLVFFSNPETGRAAIVLDGEERELRRLSVEGADVSGRPGAQTFATDTGDVSVRLSVQSTEPVAEGYRVTAASLRLTNTEGWSGVVATAGLAACRT